MGESFVGNEAATTTVGPVLGRFVFNSFDSFSPKRKAFPASLVVFVLAPSLALLPLHAYIAYIVQSSDRRP